jgi:hypothetical protein
LIIFIAEKKSHRRHHKKTIETDPPKAKFDNLFPNSTVIETPLPVFNKAPETTELVSIYLMKTK